jgi:uncharacterized protein (DUF433 family)
MDDFDELLDTSYRDRIVTDPNILVGKPTVKGTRISVELVLDFLAAELDLNELFAAYPRLTRDDVRAVLAYARAVVIGAETAPRPLTGAGTLRGQ